MDEQPVQLHGEKYEPIPAAPGRLERHDYEYVRNGTASVFIFTEPLVNRRSISVRERRTRVDWAHEIKRLLTVEYPDAEKIVLVCDNLNTHNTASLYTAFPPEEARSLARRLEIHYTPKHGSWLNIAEIELSVYTRQCLSRRVPTIETLKKESDAWCSSRNANGNSVDWRFTTDDARIKLKRLYPHF